MSFPLTASTITRMYLYGSSITPPLLTDRLRDVGFEHRESVSIDTESYLSSYLGKYIVAARFTAVQSFFYGFEQLIPGRYTSDRIAGTAGEAALTFSHEQARLDVNNNNYIQRAYIFGHETFGMSSSAVFIVEDDGSRRIEGLVYGIDADNFDFESTGAAQYLNDNELKPVIDPYGIGRTVNIEYIGTAVPRTYTQVDFERDIIAINEWDSSSSGNVYASIALGIIQLENQMKQEGVFEYYSPSRTIMYGSREDDTLSHSDAQSQLAPFVLVAGSGDDTIQAGVGNDTVYGGAGDDNILVSEGNDTIFGGYELEKGKIDDFDTVDYSAASKPISIEWEIGSVLKVKDGLGGTDTLHSVEQIKGTAARDSLILKGDIALNTSLIVDAAGGQSPNPRDSIIFKDAASAVRLTLQEDGTGELLSTATGGRIILVGFHTAIVGSDHDDVIDDQSTGHKQIDGGAGNDIISAGGNGATLLGGDDNDHLTGGSGNDVLVGGEGTDILDGGAGSDILSSSGSLSGDSPEQVNGGEGSDKLIVTRGGSVILDGGAGNDIYHVEDRYSDTTVKFLVGSGNDEVTALPRFEDFQEQLTPVQTFAYGPGVDATSLDYSDLMIVWDARKLGDGLYGDDAYIGDAALVIKATGESVLFRSVTGIVNSYNKVLDMDGLHNVQTAEGRLFYIDGGGPAVDLVFGSVTQYDVAASDFAAEQANDTPSPPGGDGDDQLRGTGGDDDLSGGGGDDEFESSSGNDTIDGGAGDDTYDLFGGLSDFEIALDAQGALVITGKQDGSSVKLRNIESINFVGRDAIVGADGIISGTSDADNLSASVDHRYAFGLGGDDVLSSGVGDDYLSGGEGVDTATFSGASAEYEIRFNGKGGFTIKDLVTNREGTDEIVEVEQVRFSDGTFAPEDLAPALPIKGSASANSLWGTDKADTILGYAGDDGLYGGGGDDLLDGGDGDDTGLFYDGDADSYIISVEEGGYRISSGDGRYEGSDTLRSVEYLRFYDGVFTPSALLAAISGSEGVDVLNGTSGADILFGRAGDDILSGGADNDFLGGGEGFDTASFSGASTEYQVSFNDTDGFTIKDLANGRDGTDNIANVERISFSDGAFRPGALVPEPPIEGTESDNYLTGSEEADIILGYGGDDEISGGSGDDVIDGGNGEDTASYQGYSENYTVTAEPDGFRISSGVDGYDGTDILRDIEYLRFYDGVLSPSMLAAASFGTDNADALSGTSAADALLGRGGDDVLTGGGGDDYLSGGDGMDIAAFSGASTEYEVGRDDAGGFRIQDQASGRDGTDRIYGVERISFSDGSFAPETLVPVPPIEGTAYDDELSGTYKAETILGYAGDDSIFGNDGDDIIDGGDGEDTVFYHGYSNDFTITAEADGYRISSQVVEYVGADTLRNIEYLNFYDGDFSPSTLFTAISGSDADDVLNGTSAADLIHGGAGNDKIHALEGDDFLSGGPGDDLLDGSLGNDIVRFEGFFYNYNITWQGNVLVVQSPYWSEEGTDRLISVEVLRFQGGDYYPMLDNTNSSVVGPSWAYDTM